MYGTLKGNGLKKSAEIAVHGQRNNTYMGKFLLHFDVLRKCVCGGYSIFML